MKATVCISTILMGAAAWGQDLPKPAPSGSAVDFPPRLMLDGTGALPAIAEAPPAASPDDVVKQKQAALVEAEKRAVDGEQLVKEGILAKVEAEEREMRVVQARKALADAVLAAASARADAVKKAFDAHQAAQADMDAANHAVDAARNAVAAAAADWARAQLDAATLDLKRKRKLYGEGVITRHELETAEDRVAFLTGSAPR
ncbi:MAG TPA: hypothetical protein VHY22_10545 [Chthoniobacteraceae bacterium]|nr:hypothetical protein [Chthoniobacteraceae bacterium]